MLADHVHLPPARATIRHLRPRPDGSLELLSEEEATNVITTAGRDFLHQQGYGSSGLGANGLNWIGLSDDALTETSASTTLSNEIAANGLSRAQATLGAALAESVALAEGLSGQTTLAASLAESVALSEGLGLSFSASATLAESVALAEAITARLQLPPVLRAGLELSTTATALAVDSTSTDLDLSTTRTAATMTSILRSDTDSADTFRATLTRDGSPYSLVGAQSVSLRWRRRGGTRGSLALTVTNAAGGVVERAWQADDLEPGAYEVQVRVVDTNGDQLSFPNHTYQTLTVLPAL
jgi:hypothetical protein